ncbi:uncharacterized protein SPSC_05619 [Sporisorium scitamineum]|uniref:Protein OS-9 homolog n=1 Tax=Sporisorium scitamineum TaxID=49012 RepID=A0A127Z644_9BASI|nr:uncharacterized protein SPSC_05619 [Sporisorium scitamineum]
MLSPSPVSAKPIVFLLGLLYLQAHTVDAAISTSAGFPQDVFAKPAFRVNFGRIDKDAPTLPIKYSDALNLLEQQQQQQASSSSPSASSQSFPPQSSRISSLAVTDRSGSHSSNQQDEAPQTLFWSLQRTSPDEFQLCSIPDFSHESAGKPSSSRQSASFAGSLRPRHELIRTAQALLDPLKKVCLYHTTDWFTYSFCHGREIRQFRQLGAQTAAQKAFKAAGGGEAGKNAAIEAAEKISKQPHPTADPDYPAFILGRWTRQNEDIVGGSDRHQRRQQQQPLVSEPARETTGVEVASNRGLPSVINAAGLDLVEEVQFGDWDEEELFAAEAKALSQLKDSQSNNAVEAARDAASGANGQASQRRRYLTQRWTNGTMCDMNHQPRTVEVQFHCSNRKPLEDRIVMFKETTICNYVLIIETPRLCADPAFGSEKEEAPLPIQCHAVVRDDFAGPTVGDPNKVVQPPATIDDGAGAEEVDKGSTKSVEYASSNQNEATVSSPDEAKEATTTSHTYGDPSRFGSVHDDYYDEALGGPGAMYRHFNHDHDHDHDHDQDSHYHHDDEEEEIVVEIGLDQDGKVLVNKVTDPTPGGHKETRRREGGKKRSDDDTENDEQPLKIQLDVDDLLSVLRGEEGGSLEKKLADKISQVLNEQMQQQQHKASSSSQTGGDDDDDGSVQSKKQAKRQTRDDLAKLYQRLLSTVTGDTGAGKKQEVRKGKQSQQQPALRMEKVGDSLSERVKRFYEAKERKDDKQKAKADPPTVGEHLEL